MKDVRFYLEFNSSYHKRKGQHNGNVFAAFIGNKFDGKIEGVGALSFHANSAVCWTAVSFDYLRKSTKRISEAKARTIHPALFDRLDGE